MLNYKLKQNCIDPNSIQPIQDYLKSLGIEKVESFINKPDKDDELSGLLLCNAHQCITALNQGFTNNKKFLLIVDSDVDGFTSSAIFYRYFKTRYPETTINYLLHEGKEHGIELDKLPPLDTFDYLIVPDAGSMNLVEQKELADKGKTIIIMDHHNVTSRLDNSNVILVNNQCSPLFSNKSLSGAGVVYKIIQIYDLMYADIEAWGNRATKYADLAALGIIADCMDTRVLDNNYIIYHGLNNINNAMIEALIKQQQYSITHNPPTKIDMAFYVAPIINGTIREGTQEEKELLFKGFIEEPTQEFFDTEWRGNARHEDYYAYVARTSYNVKNRQNSKKEKSFLYLCKTIEEKGLDKNKVIAIVTSKDDAIPTPPNITGLIAMELSKKYNKPTLVLRPKIENGVLTYAGSGRAKQVENFPSFLQFVRDTDASLYGEGHNFAFGASILASEYDNFIQQCNERLEDVDFNNEVIEVDAIFSNKKINTKMLYDFAKHEHVYGNLIPQPKIAIEGECLARDLKVMGKDMSSVRLTIGNVACVKFKDEELAKAVLNNTSFKYKLIGRPQINYFNGYENIQIMIDDIELIPTAAKLGGLF